MKPMVDASPAKPRLAGLYLRNMIANITGNLIIVLLNTFTPIAFFKDWQNFLLQGGWVLLVVLIPTVFTTAVVLQYRIQRPISIIRLQIHLGNEVDDNFQKQARRRLLNLPVLLALTNLILWTVASIVFMPVLYFISNKDTCFIWIRDRCTHAHLDRNLRPGSVGNGRYRYFSEGID